MCLAVVAYVRSQQQAQMNHNGTRMTGMRQSRDFVDDAQVMLHEKENSALQGW